MAAISSAESVGGAVCANEADVLADDDAGDGTVPTDRQAGSATIQIASSVAGISRHSPPRIASAHREVLGQAKRAAVGLHLEDQLPAPRHVKDQTVGLHQRS